MQQVIEKSLRTTVLQQISKLNLTNAQFYAMLRKINMNDVNITESMNEKLQAMKQDIRSKIKQLSTNIDLMYQMFDRKIMLLIRKMEHNFANPSQFQQQLKITKNKIKQLEEQSRDARSKYSAVLTQNQYLKAKNIALVQQLEIMSKKKTQTTTNDSSRNINAKNDTVEDYDNSLQGYVSPIQQPLKTVNTGNDLTFNKNVILNNLNLTNKKIKSQQNSFSSVLIKQQNSFQPSYGSDRKQSSKLTFGCMPVRNHIQNQNSIKFELNRKRQNTSNEHQQNQSHRMSFLINNLKQSQQSSFVSSSSSRYHFSREESANKSVLSKGVVKKYHI